MPKLRTRTDPGTGPRAGGRFEPLRLLGTGSLARVELVRERKTGASFTRKSLDARDEERLGVLEREFRLRARLAHPQVPSPHALGHEVDESGEARAYLLTEYVEGVDLAEALRLLGAESTGLLLTQALSALSWLHQCGVVHGDLKPANLCVAVRSERPLLRLLDFGAALDRNAGEVEWIGGTPAYLAPGLRAGTPPGPWSDLFALGKSFLDASEATGTPLDGELEQVLRRMTRSDPDLAYGSADAVLAELESRLPDLARRVERDGLPVPREGPMVGRETERARLATKRDGLGAGMLHRNLVLVTGPSGAGKSRLLREFGLESVLSGCESFALRCTPRAGPLEPILELFARLFPDEHPARERLARALAPASSATEPEGEGLSQRTLRDLARALRDEAIRRPLLVLIDDLGEADEPTIDFLRLFARIEAPHGPLILAARTELGAEDHPSIAALIADRVGVELLALAALPRAETEELVATALPARLVPPGLVAEAAQLAGGNPGAALEFALASVEGAGTGTRSALLERRLSRRSEAEQRLLRTLALLHRPAPLALLAEVAGEPGDVLEERLESLRAGQLVVRELTPAGVRHRVSSRALEELLCAGMDDEERRELHSRALAAWSAWPVSLERPADMLARHAIGAGELERGFRLGRVAVRRTLERGSLRAAEATIRELLPLLAGNEPRRELRAELLAHLGELCLLTGRPGEASARATELGDPGDPATPMSEELRVRLLSVLGAAAEAQGALERAEEILALALAPAGGLQDLAVRRRLAERLGAVRYRRGDYAGARRVWEEGAALVGAGDDGPGTAELYNDLGVLDLDEGAHDSAFERHTAALDLRRRRGDLEGESRSLSNLALVAHARGDLAGAIDLHEESLRIKRLLGTLPTLARTLRNLGVLYRHRGEYARAIECLEESIAMRCSAAEPLGEASTRRVLALLFHRKGDVAAAARELRAAREAFDRLGAGGVEAASLCEVEGRMALDLGDARRALERAEAGLLELGSADHCSARAVLLVLRGEAMLAVARRAEGLADLEQSLEIARRSGDPWQVAWSGLALARALPAGAATHPRARRELDEVVATARRLEAPELLGEALLALHDHARRAGREEEAVAALLEAEHLAARLSLPGLELRAARRLGEQAERSGLLHRAIHWWRRGVGLLREDLEAREPSAVPGMLALDEHRLLLDHLERVLPNPSGGTATTAPERLSLLIAAADDLARLPDLLAGPEGSGLLRPELLRRLLEISRAVNSLHHREEILAYLSDRLSELFGAENSQIVLLGPDGSFHLMGETTESSRRSISRTVLERVLAEQKPVLIQDTRRDLELKEVESVHRLGLASVLTAPLIVDGQPIGVIQFDHRERPGPFREEDLVVLELFAHQAATALKNMLLVERLDETIERLRSSEAELVAGERMRALGQMAAGVAHDFNNHLTIVLGITDLMRVEEGLSDAMRRDVETLETVSLTAAETVARLQEFRSEPQRRSTRVDVVRVLRQAAELGQRRFLASRKHRIRVDAQEGADSLSVPGTEAELREVMLNLIINAVQAMPAGGEVSLSARREEGRIVVRVEDQGPGVPAGIGQRVFEPFFSTKETGQGMGLAIAWGTVRRMGGTIRVETRAERERGACFVLDLPSAPGEELGFLVREEVPSLVTQARRTDARVLVVDDDPVVREVICRLLRSAGFCVRGVGAGREALRCFEEEHFDLVLTDLAMPGMGGREVARAVKRLDADCPVVLLTGAVPEVEEGHPQGADESVDLVLRKPITSRKLAEALSLSVRA